MNRLIRLLLAAAIVAAAALAQPAKAPAANGTPVEIAGQVARVGLMRGQGMPSLDVKTEDGKTWKVWLGSMRYLVERNFSPKAGDRAEVKGWKNTGKDEIIAREVKLNGETAIRLRDEAGFPLWSGGRRCCQ